MRVNPEKQFPSSTLDLARLVCCPDQVPDPDGRLIPACAYNLF